jgi:hypothetical protein
LLGIQLSILLSIQGFNAEQYMYQESPFMAKTPLNTPQNVTRKSRHGTGIPLSR